MGSTSLIPPCPFTGWYGFTLAHKQDWDEYFSIDRAQERELAPAFTLVGCYGNRHNHHDARPVVPLDEIVPPIQRQDFQHASELIPDGTEVLQHPTMRPGVPRYVPRREALAREDALILLDEIVLYKYVAEDLATGESEFAAIGKVCSIDHADTTNPAAILEVFWFEPEEPELAGNSKFLPAEAVTTAIPRASILCTGLQVTKSTCT